jgi:hypothetical protein
MAIKIEKLFIYTPGKSKSIAKVFIPYPEENKIQFFGQLMGILEIDSQDKNYYQILEQIAIEIEESYYDFSQVRQHSHQTSEHFEECLKYINSKILQILINHHLEKKIDLFHFFVGVIKNNNILFSYSGDICAFLVYKSKTSMFRIADIIGNYQKINNEKTDLFRIFSHFIEGEFKPCTYLIFTTQKLLDHITLDEIKHYLSHMRLDVAVDEIRNNLWQASINTSFAVLLAENIPQHRYETNEKLENFSQKSLNRLLHTEDQTKKILSIPFLPDFEKYKLYGIQLIQKIHKLFELFNIHWSKFFEQIMESKAKSFFLIRKLKEPIFTLNTFFSAIHRDISKVTIPSFLIRWKLFISDNKEYLGSRLIQSWRMISLKQKIIGLAGIVLFTLFITGIYIQSKERQLMNNESSFRARIDAIETLLERIEGKLIYRDEANLTELFINTEQNINQLSEETEEYKILKTKLENRFEQLRLSRRKAKTLDNLEKIAELPNNSADVSKFILFFKNNLYFFSHDALYKIIPGGHAAEILRNPELLSLSLKSGNINEARKSAIFLTADNKLITFDFSTEKLEFPFVAWNKDEKSITDIALYNNKLYTLAPQSEQIFRHPFTSSGYPLGQKWVKKKNTSFLNASSFAVDGSIFVLYTDGSISHFLTGREIQYSLSSIEPKFTHASKIITSTEMQNIYVFEKGTKRIAMFAKDRIEFQSQWFIKLASDISDVVVDEKNDQLYILSENIVYRSSFPKQ